MKKLILAVCLALSACCHFAHASDIHITAEKQVEWHQKENKIVAVGDAVATKDAMNVRADRLIGYYAGRESTTKGKSSITRMQGIGSVKLHSPRADGFGDKLDYDLIKDEAVLTGNPAKIKTEKEIITARDKITYYPSEQKAIALGNVEAIDKDNNKVYADKMIAFFVKDGQNTQNLTLDKVELYDHVKIVTPDTVVTSDKGLYRPRTGKVYLYENIVINQQGNILRGDKAETDLNTGISKLLSKSKSGRVKGVFKEKDAKKAEAKPVKPATTTSETHE